MDFIAGAVALSTLLGGAAVVVTVPDSKPACTVRFEMRQEGAARVETCSDGSQTVRPAKIIAKAAPGTGGLVFRDEQGNDLGSGVGQNQTFIFVNCGPEGSGLINVYQLDTNGEEGISGGWGSLYAGYVKKAFTENPSDYPCK
jgi:hypothetical protein